MVYVLNTEGQPLMPTTRFGRVRHLLHAHKAVIVHYRPFTIQLKYTCLNKKQSVSLGVDAGSKHVGLSATTKKKVLFEAQLELRDDIVKKLATRREMRIARRQRKTRYRKPRFLNRTKRKKKGWLAPSILHKVNAHVCIISKIASILPLDRITIEVAQFDTQLLKANENGLLVPFGTDYQKGEQFGFWNVREYVLFRDGHKCQCCKGKSGDSILNVHHIESRKTGGDAPNNLITLCETCHKKFHKGQITLPAFITRGARYRDAVFMGIIRKEVYRLLKTYNYNLMHLVNITYGYITKHTRIQCGLPKSHIIDARCISGNPLAIGSGDTYWIKLLRHHNRQIHKTTVMKGGVRKRNQASKEVFGFRLKDTVKYNGTVCYVQARRTSGQFSLVDINGQRLTDSISYKKLYRINYNGHYMIGIGESTDFDH